MDWRKILKTLKRFFKGVWEVLKYYVPIILGKIAEGLIIFGKFLVKTFKKVRKWLKRYIRKVVKHTKAGDYSLLIYTSLIVIAVILAIVLLCNAIKGSKSSKKSKTETATTTEATTEDPAVAAQNQLISQATTIYQNNQALLILVNSTHPLDESYSFEHHTLNCGKDIDARALEDLKAMLTACNEAGFEYNILSAYIDRQGQQALVDEEIQKIVAAEGLSQEEATTKALQTVPAAGCNESETGLAIDLTGAGVYSLDNFSADDATTQWLINNSYSYGFIVRYTDDKSSFTGYSGKPWHFRYVGREAAAFLHDNNLCLEEFYNLIGIQ